MSCNCNKPNKPDTCGISPAVLSVTNNNCTLFHKVIMPASMGDSKENPPYNGMHKNVLLYYEADQTSWLFSSDGVPTKLVSGVQDYEAAINLPQINGETLIGDKSSADLKLADAPMVITIASGNTVWSGADTAEDIYNFFLNQGKVNVVFEGSENYGYEIISAAYIPGEQKMMCTVAVAGVDTGSSPVDFSGDALYGLMTFYTAGKAVDVGELDLQPKLSITDFTGLDMIDGYILEGVPATGFSIGMVKPGDGLEVASDGTLSVNTEVTHTFDTVADMKASTALKAGDVAQTLGFHSLNDGGAATYKIASTGTADEKAVIAVGDLFAEVVVSDKVNPQMFGAYGYKGTYDSTKSDSTTALQFTTKYAIDHNIKTIEYLGFNYNCEGNNIIGLEIKSTNTYAQVDVNGNGAIFYWDSKNDENFSFAFVGYLRYSTWQSFQVRCLNGNYKGNIFTTHFGIANQNHWFSCNKFTGIAINAWWTDGTCNKVIDFTSDGTHTHDDLSVFEEINANYYLNFFYTSNNESVSNEFRNCYTVSYAENTVDFFIDCTAWSGHLNIVNHQFILTQPNGILVKTSEANSELHFPIKLTNCRLEVRYAARQFKYCDLKSYDLYIDSLKPLSSFSVDNSNVYFEVSATSSLYITNCEGLPPYIKINTATAKKRGNIIVENSSFINNNTSTPMPYFIYDSFANYQAMIANPSPRYFNNTIIKNGVSASKSEWFENYHLSTQDYTSYTAIHKVINEQYRSTIIPWGNIVLEELKVHNSTADKCDITVSNYNGQGSTSRTNIAFTNGIADLTDGKKCVLPEGKQNAFTITLKDSGGTALDNQECIVEIKYRPIVYADELAVSVNSWINK